ncbi:MAG: homoserine O-acetyltransferase, partial [Pseudomonadota bacterium]
IVTALYANNLEVSYAEIEAHQGHDAFLMPIAQYVEVFGGYMDRVARECGA